MSQHLLQKHSYGSVSTFSDLVLTTIFFLTGKTQAATRRVLAAGFRFHNANPAGPVRFQLLVMAKRRNGNSGTSGPPPEWSSLPLL